MFCIAIPYLDLDQVYKSGQVYDWKKIRAGKYIIPYEDKIISIEQRKDNFLLSCSEQEFYDIWYNYFDLDTDYAKLHWLYKSLDDEIKICCNRANGMRILQQPYFETFIICLLKQNMNKEKVKCYINELKTICGKKHVNSLGEAGRIKWYEFPSPSDIIRNEIKLLNKLDRYKKVTLDIIQLAKDATYGWLYQWVGEDNDSNIEYLKYFGFDNNSAKDLLLCLGNKENLPFDYISDFVFYNLDIDNEDDFYTYFLSEIETYYNGGYLAYVILYNILNPPPR